MKTDKNDLRILFELDRDVRKKHSDIARQIRKSPQYVKYRVAHLKQEHIRSVTMIVNFYQLKYREITCYIKLKGVDLIEEKKLLDFLVKCPNTYRLYYCDGRINILCTFVLKTLNEIPTIKEVLEKEFPIIDKLQFSINTRTEIYEKSYLIDEPCSRRILLAESTEEAETEIERQLFQRIQQDPFASLLEISERIGTNYDKVSRAYKERKIIKGNLLTLAPAFSKKAVLLLSIKNGSAEIKKFGAVHSNISQIDETIGSTDLIVFIECFDDPKRIVREIILKFKDTIRDYERLDIINTYKYRFTAL